MKLKKLNNYGFSHDLLAIAVVIMVAIAGIGYMVASHADPTNAHVGFIDISSPQCIHGSSSTIVSGYGHYRFGIVGLNGTGLEFRSNPCLHNELSHFDSYALYVGTNYPSPSCPGLNPYQCGQKAGQDDINKMAGLHPSSVWIDVEPGINVTWSHNPTNNAQFLIGMYNKLHAGQHAYVGFYSNHNLWQEVAANKIHLNTYLWYAAGVTNNWQASCRANFGGDSKVLYVQYEKVLYGQDYDRQC